MDSDVKVIRKEATPQLINVLLLKVIKKVKNNAPLLSD